MTRFLLTVSCALLPCLAMAAVPLGRKPGGPCPPVPAECRVSAPVFNFGRAEMTPTSSAVLAHAIISVTCTKAHGNGFDVDVTFELKGLPPAPARQMRDRIEGAHLRYDMFLDPARTRYWGDGQSHGTFAIQGGLFLDDRNKVGTLAFPLYGRVDGGQLVPSGPFLGAVISKLEYRLSCRS